MDNQRERRRGAGVLTLVLAVSLAGGLLSCTPAADSAPDASPADAGGGSSPTAGSSPTPALSTVSFENLARGSSRSDDAQSPFIVIAGDRDEVRRVLRFVSDRGAISQLQTLDSTRHWVVAVNAGPKPSAGHGIEIRSIAGGPGLVRITVEQTQPAAGSAGAAVVSYPYHAVLIPRDQLNPAMGTNWEVYDGSGALLTRATYPDPTAPVRQRSPTTR